jgi:hypothetical protein
MTAAITYAASFMPKKYYQSKLLYLADLPSKLRHDKLLATVRGKRINAKEKEEKTYKTNRLQIWKTKC